MAEIAQKPVSRVGPKPHPGIEKKSKIEKLRKEKKSVKFWPQLPNPARKLIQTCFRRCRPHLELLVRESYSPTEISTSMGFERRKE